MSVKLDYEIKKAELAARIDAVDALFQGPNEYLEFLYSCIPGGLKCRFCSYRDFEFSDDCREAQCLNCRRTTRPTASTFFHNLRRPCDWVRCIFIRAEGFPFSANLFSVVTGMAQSSVNDMLKKIRHASVEKMKGDIEALSASCTEVVNKRSLCTPAMDHPTAEERMFAVAQSFANYDELIERALDVIYPPASRTNNSHERENKGQEASACDVRFGDEKNVFETLESGPLTFEQILEGSKLAAQEAASALTNLQLADVVKIKADGSYNTTPTFMGLLGKICEPKLALRSFFRFVKSVFHGVSRKYLQLYFVDHWHFLASGRIQPRALMRLLMRSPQISGKQVTKYVTPPVVIVDPKRTLFAEFRRLGGTKFWSSAFADNWNHRSASEPTN